MMGLMGGGLGPIGGMGSDEEGKIPLEALLGLGVKAALGSAQQGKLPIMGILQNPNSLMPQANKAASPTAPTSSTPPNGMSDLSPEQFEKLKALLNAQQP